MTPWSWGRTIQIDIDLGWVVQDAPVSEEDPETDGENQPPLSTARTVARRLSL